MNKTIVIITPGFPVNEEDTSCIPPQQVFVKALKKNYPALNIIVVTFQYPYLTKEYSWNGIKVISLGGKNKGNIYRFFLWIRAWNKLKTIRSNSEIIGMLSFWMGECALIGSYFGKIFKIKHLCWILGQDAKSNNKYFRLIKPVPENLIALSDFIADEVYKNYFIKVQNVIPIGIDNEMFEKKTKERSIDVLGVGSLIAIKQYDLFISVIKEIKNTLPDIHVVLCGEGPDKMSLQLLINEYGLQKNIFLTGEISHLAVLNYMQMAKLFLHTSSYEGFGAVCAEALYAGASVISFCKPMKLNFDKWYIVNSKNVMVQKSIEILLNKQAEYSPVHTFTINEVTQKMMHLFVY